MVREACACRCLPWIRPAQVTSKAVSAGVAVQLRVGGKAVGKNSLTRQLLEKTVEGYDTGKSIANTGVREIHEVRGAGASSLPPASSMCAGLLPSLTRRAFCVGARHPVARCAQLVATPKYPFALTVSPTTGDYTIEFTHSTFVRTPPSAVLPRNRSLCCCGVGLRVLCTDHAAARCQERDCCFACHMPPRVCVLRWASSCWC